MKKVFLMLFLALGASAAMAQSQKVFNGSTRFRATLPEFSSNGKSQVFTREDNLITFYSDDFTKQSELTINDNMVPIELNDFDQSCNDFRKIYISQTIFNSDDKYEYLVSVLTDNAMTGIQVVSETGTVLQTINFPDGFKCYSKNDVVLIKINGKLYLSIEGYDADNSNTVLLCSIGTTASGSGDRTRGDVNGDGAVNAADVVKVVNIIVGK